MHVKTVETLLRARGWSQAELARRLGLSRQAISLWFRKKEANLQSRHLMRLSEVLGVPVETLVRPLPCSEPEKNGRLRATLLWDRLYPDLVDFAIAVSRSDPKAVARFVEVYGLYAAAKALGENVWEDFPAYKRYIHPVRRGGLETLWSWHKSQKAA